MIARFGVSACCSSRTGPNPVPELSLQGVVMKPTVPIAVLAASILLTLIALAWRSNGSAPHNPDTQQRDSTVIQTIESVKLV